MASKKKSNIKKRAQRATSNVFAMFNPNQIQEFKEAFYMIDQDKDGFITKGRVRWLHKLLLYLI
jgi:Ca2+-binding EF-hand superfamily protein